MPDDQDVTWWQHEGGVRSRQPKEKPRRTYGDNIVLVIWWVLVVTGVMGIVQLTIMD